jgi:2-methylcitrate dehydratase PrpD
MTALERLGEYVANARCEAQADAELLELHLIDTVAAWIAAAGTVEGAALLRFQVEQDVHEESAPARDLATRCALARLSEIDDIHLAAMITPGAIVIPGALTLATSLPDVTRDDFMAAVLAGYEAMIRLGRALDGPSILYRGIWPTYFAAPFGIAAAAARLMRLDPSQAANALALALSFAAPGVGHHNAPTTSRWVAIGNAARDGLAATLATRQGFTSDLALIDGGFAAAVLGVTPDVVALTGGLGESLALREVSFKPWCAARQTMAPTQALRETLETGVAPQSIDAVEVFVPPPHHHMVDHGVKAGDRASHLTSAQYCMARAALAPERAFDVQASPPELAPEILALMDKITITPDESLLADYPHAWPARVVVTAGSARYERRVTHIPGDPARPFDRAQLHEKFLRCIAPMVGKPEAELILRHCADALSSGQFATLAARIDVACATARRP